MWFPYRKPWDEKNCLFAQQSFPLLLFHMPVSHKYHGYRALSVVRQSMAPYSVRFLFAGVCVCVCVCLHPTCVISEILPLCFFFLCVHVTQQPLPHPPPPKKKELKKAVLHNLRYDYCSVDGVAYVNMHSCRIHKDVFFWQGCNCCCCWV